MSVQACGVSEPGAHLQSRGKEQDPLLQTDCAAVYTVQFIRLSVRLFIQTWSVR